MAGREGFSAAAPDAVVLRGVAPGLVSDHGANGRSRNDLDDVPLLVMRSMSNRAAGVVDALLAAGVEGGNP